MSEDLWREKVREAAQAAADSGLINMSELARRVGWTQPYISKFCQSGVGQYEKVAALERELRFLGFYADPLREIARELHLVADTLMSDVSEDLKTQKLNSLIDSLASGRLEGMKSESR